VKKTFLSVIVLSPKEVICTASGGSESREHERHQIQLSPVRDSADGGCGGSRHDRGLSELLSGYHHPLGGF
jgi:hypothetical protein